MGGGEVVVTLRKATCLGGGGWGECWRVGRSGPFEAEKSRWRVAFASRVCVLLPGERHTPGLQQWHLRTLLCSCPKFQRWLAEGRGGGKSGISGPTPIPEVEEKKMTSPLGLPDANIVAFEGTPLFFLMCFDWTCNVSEVGVVWGGGSRL